jgi:hypothetical protein
MAFAAARMIMKDPKKVPPPKKRQGKDDHSRSRSKVLYQKPNALLPAWFCRLAEVGAVATLLALLYLLACY